MLLLPVRLAMLVRFHRRVLPNAICAQQDQLTQIPTQQPRATVELVQPEHSVRPGRLLALPVMQDRQT